MDEELNQLLSTLGNDEVVQRLRTLMENTSRKGDCKEEKSEIERLKAELAEKERELEKTKKFVGELIRQIPKPAFVLFMNKDGVIEYINEYAAEIYGTDISEMIGKKPSELASNVAAGGRTFVELAFEKKMKVEGKEGFLEVKTGKAMPILTSCAPVYVDGEFAGMIDFFIDITEQKRKEEEARKAYELVREVFKNLPTYVIFVGEDGLIKFGNDNAAKLAGLESADEIVGLKPTDLAVIHGDYMENARKLVDAVKNRKRIENVELKLVSKDGREFFAAASVYPVYVGGEFAGYIEVFNDISELKEKEKSLQSTLSEIEAITTGMPDAFFVVDNERRIITWSKQAEKLTGYTEDFAIGKITKELFKLGDECQICRAVVKALEAGEAVTNTEATIRTANGSKQVLVSVSPRWIDGKLDGAVVFLKDLTELKKKEEEVRRAFELINEVFKKMPFPVYLLFANTDHRIQYANDELAKLAGFSSAEEIIGKHPSELFQTEGGKTVADKVLETGEPVINYQAVTRTRTGKEVPIIVSCVPIYIDGEMVGVVDLFIDISDLKEKEEEIMKTLDYTDNALELLTVGIRELQAGNLNARVKKPPKVEGVKVMERFEETVDIFNEFAERLNEIVRKLAEDMKETAEQVKEANEAVNQMNAGMQQISSASQQIATGSENLSRLANASAVDLKAAEEVFKDLNAKADNSSKYASEAAENAELAKQEGAKALDIMQGIVHEMEKASQVVENLEHAVRNIGKVTERIKSIADQTNLLALNAAIEAARAGEHGRGFAVVADEIRKLAEESRKSTDEIAEIVRNVQEETRKVIEATNNVNESIVKGSEGIERSLAMAGEIAESVSKINEMLSEVAAKAEEGLSRIQQLAKNFEEVASTAEENAASSEETSAAIEEQTAAVQQISMAMKKVNEIANTTMQVLLENFKIFDVMGREVSSDYAKTMANGGNKI